MHAVTCARQSLLSLLFPALLLSAAPSQASRVLSPHVYQVLATDCGGLPRQRAQTGFRVRGVAGIVTALHGVAGCRTLSAAPSDAGTAFTGLSVAQVDVERDVVVLSSSALSSAAGVGLEPGGEATGPELRTIGHPNGLTMQLGSRFRLGDVPRKPLGELIPPALHASARGRGSPALDIEVLSLQATLTGGHSGAPILDAAGRVVGVADGGLQGGTTGITWAIPWVDLQLVDARSQQSRIQALGQSDPGLLFSYAEDADEGRLVFTVSGLSAGQPGEEIPEELHNVDERGRIAYRSARSGEIVTITPSVPYLNSLGAGEPVSGFVLDDPYFGGELPTLDLRVVNQTGHTHFLTGAVLEVAESRLDPRPVIVRRNLPYPFRPGEIQLVNDGWGPAGDLVLRFSMRDRDGEAGASSGRTYELRGGTLEHRVDLSLRDALAAEGVDWQLSAVIDAEGRGPYVREDPGRLHARAASAAGPYSSGTALVEGELSYDAPQVSGQQVRESMPVAFLVDIFQPEGLGAPSAPSWAYEAELRVQDSAYEVEVPISHSLQPGEADRFTIRLGVASSSFHDLRVRLVYDDGATVISDPIHLEAFVPRSFANTLREEERDW